MPIRYVWDFPDPENPPMIINGTIDYYFQYKLILDKYYPGGKGSFNFGLWQFDYDIEEGYREPGAEIPNYYFNWFIPHVFGVHEISVQLTGSGIGVFTDNAEKYGFTPGARVKVTVNQIGFLKHQLGELWPVDFIKFQEIG